MELTSPFTFTSVFIRLRILHRLRGADLPPLRCEREGISVAAFIAEVPVSFEKAHGSASACPLRGPVQVDHLCSPLSPPGPRLSAPWLAFTVKQNRIIPAVKALHREFTLFSSHLMPAIQPCWVHFLAVGRIKKKEKKVGRFRCILFSSLTVTNGGKRQRKTKQKKN